MTAINYLQKIKIQFIVITHIHSNDMKNQEKGISCSCVLYLLLHEERKKKAFIRIYIFGIRLKLSWICFLSNRNCVAYVCLLSIHFHIAIYRPRHCSCRCRCGFCINCSLRLTCLIWNEVNHHHHQHTVLIHRDFSILDKIFMVNYCALQRNRTP